MVHVFRAALAACMLAVVAHSARAEVTASTPTTPRAQAEPDGGSERQLDDDWPHRSDEYEREGEEYEARSDWKECGRSMFAAAEIYPGSPRHAHRLTVAIQCFQKAHLVGQALKARVELIKDHPKDPLARDALFDVAAVYQQLAYYSKAACAYEAFATKYPSDKRAAKAHANAVEFFKALGEDADDCDTGERLLPAPKRRRGEPPR